MKHHGIDRFFAIELERHMHVSHEAVDISALKSET